MAKDKEVSGDYCVCGQKLVVKEIDNIKYIQCPTGPKHGFAFMPKVNRE